MIPMALAAAGPALQGIGANAAGRAQARALEEDAALTGMQGNLDAADAMRESRAAVGEMIAGMSGDPTSGSNADIVMQSLIEREYEAMSIRYSAGTKADQLRRDADQARKAGRNALVGGFVGAGASALGLYQERQSASEIRTALSRRFSEQMSGHVPVPKAPLGGTLMPSQTGARPAFDPLRYLRGAGYGD